MNFIPVKTCSGNTYSETRQVLAHGSLVLPDLLTTWNSPCVTCGVTCGPWCGCESMFWRGPYYTTRCTVHCHTSFWDCHTSFWDSPKCGRIIWIHPAPLANDMNSHNSGRTDPKIATVICDSPDIKSHSPESLGGKWRYMAITTLFLQEW